MLAPKLAHLPHQTATAVNAASTRGAEPQSRFAHVSVACTVLHHANLTVRSRTTYHRWRCEREIRRNRHDERQNESRIRIRAFRALQRSFNERTSTNILAPRLLRRFALEPEGSWVGSIIARSASRTERSSPARCNRLSLRLAASRRYARKPNAGQFRVDNATMGHLIDTAH